MTPGSFRARRPFASLWLVVPCSAALLAGWVGMSRDGGGLLEGVVRTLASTLLMLVVAAAAHVAAQHRDAERHASIRAEIAAAGGLKRRLMA